MDRKKIKKEDRYRDKDQDRKTKNVKNQAAIQDRFPKRSPKSPRKTKIKIEKGPDPHQELKIKKMSHLKATNKVRLT